MLPFPLNTGFQSLKGKKAAKLLIHKKCFNSNWLLNFSMQRLIIVQGEFILINYQVAIYE